MPFRDPHGLLVFAAPCLEDGARGGVECLDCAGFAACEDDAAVAADTGAVEGRRCAGDGA